MDQYDWLLFLLGRRAAEGDPSAIRPDEVNLALFAHVLGAMLLVGALFAVYPWAMTAKPG